MYEAIATALNEAARLFLQANLPAGVPVRDAHVACFYRQSFEVVFRALATHEPANALVATARLTVGLGAGRMIAYVIMGMQVDLFAAVSAQDSSEAACEQAADATRSALGINWPEGPFPNFFEIACAHRPRG